MQLNYDLYNQSQRVEHASNLYHSDYLEHLRVKAFNPKNLQNLF